MWKNKNSRVGKSGKVREIVYFKIMSTLLLFSVNYSTFREIFFKCLLTLDVGHL